MKRKQPFFVTVIAIALISLEAQSSAQMSESFSLTPDQSETQSEAVGDSESIQPRMQLAILVDTSLSMIERLAADVLGKVGCGRSSDVLRSSSI